MNNINSYIEKVDNRNIKPEFNNREWYLPNRFGYINSIHEIFQDYKIDNKDIDHDPDELFKTLTPNQKFIRDYISNLTPYRGVVLNWGLGVGKTCGSIAGVEILLNNRNVYVLTPASLKANYITEVRKCSQNYAKKGKHWKFISLDKIKKAKYLKNIKIIDNSIIRKNDGMWVTIEDKPANYNTLNNQQKDQIELQLLNIIENKYNFIHYNGLSQKKIDTITNNKTINPFENNTVLIEEVHNFISMIANKSKIALQIYELLYKAQNIKIIALSGTLIINKPFELALLINLLKGQILFYNFKLTLPPNNSQLQSALNMLQKYSYVDIVDYDPETKQFMIKLLPFGFRKKSEDDGEVKVKIDKDGKTREDILKTIREGLKQLGLSLSPIISEDVFDPLPFKEDIFNSIFIEGDQMRNQDLFSKKVLGAVSYFKNENPKDFPTVKTHLVKLEMSNYQFEKYQKVRSDEIKKELFAKRNSSGRDAEAKNTVYKAYTRALCNFVFPDKIFRPFPSTLRLMMMHSDTVDDYNKNIIDKVDKEENNLTNTKNSINLSNKKDFLKMSEKAYQDKINQIMLELQNNKDDYLINKPNRLDIYSPKFSAILNNIDKSQGSVLVYSQFREVEGLGIFKLAMQANGYVEFKLRKIKGEYQFDNFKDEDINKPKYIEFGDKELTDIILAIFNNEFDKLPSSLKKQLNNVFPNIDNLRGQIIKVLMITQSGSEGISLKNCRQVHILEPYWNKLRLDQVGGRAARTKSHTMLPKSEQIVDVYTYLVVIPDAKFKDKEIGPKLKRLDDGRTTDEVIYDIAKTKENLNNQFLDKLKGASIDCRLYKMQHPSVSCFNYPVDIKDNQLVALPNIYEELSMISQKRIQKEVVNVHVIKIKDKIYIILLDTNTNTKKLTGQLFDFDKYRNFGQLDFVGLLMVNKEDKYVLRMKKRTSQSITQRITNTDSNINNENIGKVAIKVNAKLKNINNNSIVKNISEKLNFSHNLDFDDIQEMIISDKFKDILRKLSRNMSEDRFKSYIKLFVDNVYKNKKAYDNPIIRYKDIKHQIPYGYKDDVIVSNLHVGQRKLFLSEIEFLTIYSSFTKVKNPIVFYAGAAPGNKTWYLAQLFPNMKFILVDPNPFNLFVGKGQKSHRKKEYEGIIHLKTGRGKDYEYNGKKWEMKDHNPEEILNYIKNSNDNIFIIEDYVDTEMCKLFKPLVNVFISDIRTEPDNYSEPTDVDLVWNSAQQYIWLNALKPELYMIKFRMPFYDQDMDKFNKEYNKRSLNNPVMVNDIKLAKEQNIDFIKNYKDKQFEFFKGKLYIQAFANRKSTELRLIGDSFSTKKYNIEEYESKLYYFNLIERSYVLHKNKYANRDIGFDYCNDCSREAQIWENYIKLNFDKSGNSVIDYVNNLSNLSKQSLLDNNNSHGYLYHKPNIQYLQFVYSRKYR